MWTRLGLALGVVCLFATLVGADPPQVIKLWPGKPPGEVKELPPEIDLTKPEDKPVGGRPIIKLTNVSNPTLAIYRPQAAMDTGAAVIVCPGGGHRILAYDHEGTEVAEWLAKIGVTGVVLKYRVPARDPDKRWLAAVQDAQRAVSLVRGTCKGIDPKRVGILGFSAGGETAGLTALFAERQYSAVDDVDAVSARPDFAALIYPGGLLEKDNTRLRSYVRPTKETPPMFLVHAFDDRVDPRASLLLAAALKEAEVPCELHVYATGGHGFGIRDIGHPIAAWPARLQEWMGKLGFLKK